ncbi:MAG: HNH endonuclease [Pseudohongiellaceae bacterium]
MKERTKYRYNDSLWKRTRLQILQRDGYRCTIGLPKCRGVASQVDHIVPLAYGGSKYEPTNLRASCATCNSTRSNQLRRKPSRVW